MEDAISFNDFVSNDFGESQKFIAYCQSSQPLKTAFKSDDKIVIVTGPEGGFTPEEVELAKSKGFVTVSISSYRLRTETAALMAVADGAFVFFEK